jgi:uridine phosphorylase
MPARLRPTADFAADAILVGDPGRALALAQTLLVAPKMSNHARGLWGYTGETHAGAALTLQATGMGGPSAALVLADLAELGVRRAIRVGTATGLSADLGLGGLMVVNTARAWDRDMTPGDPALPDPRLAADLIDHLGDSAREGEVASLDFLLPAGLAKAPRAEAADMQTAALLAAGPGLGMAIAAVLIVESTSESRLDDDALTSAAERAGSAAAAAFSTSKARL